MASSRISKLLGRQVALPPAVETALGRLRTLAETEPDVQELAATTAALLQRMYTDVPALPFTFTAEQIEIKLEGAVPLLRGEQLALDGKLLSKQFGALCAVMEAQGHPAAHDLGTAIRRGRLDLLEAVQAVLQGDATLLVRQADAQALDAALAATLLRLTLLPLLEQISAAARSVRREGMWSESYCSTCGAWPLLGEYRGLEQSRWLRCGVCGDEWTIDRLVCFACGSRDHSALHYLEVNGEELKQRVHTCDRCHTYIKQISTLDRLDTPALLVADVASLHLDLIALERGYSQPH